ncbi:MAG: hypothetical protein AAFX52_11205 [Pseudomonadota bacterium]
MTEFLLSLAAVTAISIAVVVAFFAVVFAISTTGIIAGHLLSKFFGKLS